MNPIDAQLRSTQKRDARLLQARIPKPLYEALRAKLKKENVTIQDFMEASVIVYLEGKSK